jgi:hypothetical protein
MYSVYTPLQYIEPATITTVATPVVTQTPKQIQPVQSVQYNSPAQGCAIVPTKLVPKTPVGSAVMATPANSPAMISTVASPVVPVRSKTETTPFGPLDEEWSDTNEIRVSEDLNVVTFEFVESNIDLKIRANTVKKSDEVVKFYETPQEAKKAVEFLLKKLQGIPNVTYEIKPRTGENAFVRILINYLTDSADGFFTFNGYITIYSGADETLDKITRLLETDFKKKVPAVQSPVMQTTVIKTPVIQTPFQAQTPVNTPVAQIQTPVAPMNTPVAQIQTTTPVVQTPVNTPSQLVYSTPQSQVVNYNSRFSPRTFLSDYQ